MREPIRRQYWRSHSEYPDRPIVDTDSFGVDSAAASVTKEKMGVERALRL